MRRAGRVGAAILVLGLMTAAARPARADSNLDVLVFTALALVVTDVTFAGIDIVHGAKGELPDSGYAAAEMIVCIPQALAFNPLLVFFARDDSEDVKQEPLFPLLVIPTAGVTALALHGGWRTANEDVDPVVLPAVSSAIGANTTLTLNALFAAGDGELVGRPMGVAQAIFTAPSLLGATYGAIHYPEDRAAWIGLSAWSGALFLHGVASAIWDGPEDEPVTRGQRPREKAPPLVPTAIQLLPGVVTDGVATAPGLVVGGRF